MLSWLFPIGLLGFAVIPLIWWLHRVQPKGRDIMVSSVLFWRQNQTNSPQSTRGTVTDPIWFLRALTAGLLVLALSGPQWATPRVQNIHIWFDDSLSMKSQEDSIKREIIAGQILLRNIQRFEAPRVSLYSLSHSDKPILLLEKGNQNNWGTLIEQWLSKEIAALNLPIPTQMNSEAEHWLITDASNKKLLDWLKYAPISKLIQVGKETENSALTLFSIRQDLKQTTQWEGVIEVVHHGIASHHKTLELLHGNIVQQSWEIELTPEEPQQIPFKWSGSIEQALTARLSPNDVLELDDSLQLFTPVKISTQVLGNCSTAINALISSHPNLDAEHSTAENVVLNILCGDIETPPDKGHILKFHQSKQRSLLDSPAVWSQKAGQLNKLFLPQESLLFYISDQKESAETALLVSGSISLITLSEFPRRILNCYLDMNQSSFSSLPEYPALFAGLVDITLNQSILNKIQRIYRDPMESIISSEPVSHLEKATDKHLGKVTFYFTPYLIIFAIILLIVDIWLLWNKNLIKPKSNLSFNPTDKL